MAGAHDSFNMMQDDTEYASSSNCTPASWTSSVPSFAWLQPQSASLQSLSTLFAALSTDDSSEVRPGSSSQASSSPLADVIEQHQQHFVWILTVLDWTNLMFLPKLSLVNATHANGHAWQRQLETFVGLATRATVKILLSLQGYQSEGGHTGSPLGLMVASSETRHPTPALLNMVSDYMQADLAGFEGVPLSRMIQPIVNVLTFMCMIERFLLGLGVGLTYANEREFSLLQLKFMVVEAAQILRESLTFLRQSNQSEGAHAM